MTRVRFDPSFVEDERWERLGGDALVLHFVACSYALRTLSDGVLSEARVRTLTPLVGDCAVVAARLVEDGLWEELGDGRLRVCHVRDDLRHSDGRGDEQPSRVFVEGERARARKRKESWRAKKKELEADGTAITGENASRNAVPMRNRVPNGGRNTPQSSADQPSAVQDPQGPGPALRASTVEDTCADGLCDGMGWVESPSGGVSKCSDLAWHRRQEPSWQQRKPA